jgi:Proton-conducting membrane transporter
MIGQIGGGDVSNIDLLTSLRLNTEILLKNILLFSSLLSLIIGTVLGLSQIKIKRLLAYSTISHVGFLLLCLAIKTEVSIESFIFYLIQYSLTNLNGFLILLAFPLSMNYLINYKGIPITLRHSFSNFLDNMKNMYNPLSYNLYKNPRPISEGAEDKLRVDERARLPNTDKLENLEGFRELTNLHRNFETKLDNPYITSLAPTFDSVSLALSLNKIKIIDDFEESKKDLLFIKELQDQFKFNPALSLSFAITLFSMAGIPPFIGFFGKQSVIYSAIDSGFYFMTFVAILVSVISAAYYLRLIKESYSHSTRENNISEISQIPKEIYTDNKTQLSSTNDSLPTHTKEYSVISFFMTLLDYSLKMFATQTRAVEVKFINLSNIHAFIISLLTFTIVFFFFNTSLFLNSASLITLNYFYL